MQDKTSDTDGIQTLEKVGSFEELASEKSEPAKAGRPKRVDETPTAVEEAVPVSTAVRRDRVMDEITIRELEMMRRIDEINQLEEILVGGTTNIEPEVIGAIAGVAAEAVPGVVSLGAPSLRRVVRERFGGVERKARGVEVEAGSREVILDINVRVIYGYSIPLTVANIRQNVANRLLDLCGLIAKEINIRVTGIEFPVRMPGRVQ